MRADMSAPMPNCQHPAPTVQMDEALSGEIPGLFDVSYQRMVFAPKRRDCSTTRSVARSMVSVVGEPIMDAAPTFHVPRPSADTPTPGGTSLSLTGTYVASLGSAAKLTGRSRQLAR